LGEKVKESGGWGRVTRKHRHGPVSKEGGRDENKKERSAVVETKAREGLTTRREKKERKPTSHGQK